MNLPDEPKPKSEDEAKVALHKTLEAIFPGWDANQPFPLPEPVKVELKDGRDPLSLLLERRARAFAGLQLPPSSSPAATAATSEASLEGLSEPAFVAFTFLADRWDLTLSERAQILNLPEAEFHQWSSEPSRPLSEDTLTRISHLLSIYSALAVLIPDEAQAYAWMKRPNQNALFGGRTPLSFLIQGPTTSFAAVHKLMYARMNVW